MNREREIRPDDDHASLGQLSDVGTDPWLTDSERSPHDPLGTATAAEYLTGAAIKQARKSRWVRYVALFIAVASIVGIAFSALWSSPPS